MDKAKKKKRTRGKVLLRKIDKTGEHCRIAKHSGTLFLFSYGRGKGKTIAIYGDPKGLKFLAKLLIDVANVDQTKIPDKNCPNGIGAHYHVYKSGGQLHTKSTDLVVSRLDGKKTGSHKWFLPLMDEQSSQSH